MSLVCTFKGRTSYSIRNKQTEIFVSMLGGNIVVFFCGGEKINPYFIAPWWNEGWIADGPDILNVCRGNFFACPMGGDGEGVLGKPQPVHGFCANENWQLADAGRNRIALNFEKDGLRIQKELQLSEDASAIYEKNIVSGLSGSCPVAYHPMIQLPGKTGSAHLKLGGIKLGYTTPTPHEDPSLGGYCLFSSNQLIQDMTRVKTMYGDSEDLTMQPIRSGFEEVVLFTNDEEREFCFSAVTFIADGYVYYQLKNPRILNGIMLWISNGGRHYAPWLGRCKNVLALEDTISFFHYGASASAEENFLNKQGIRTACWMAKEKEYEFPIIYGVAQVPGGFCGVEDITSVPDGICIIGTHGEKIYQNVDMNFLLQEPVIGFSANVF